MLACGRLKAALLRSTEELQDSSFRLILSLLLHGAASVHISDCYEPNDYFSPFFLFLFYWRFLLLDELSSVCVVLLLLLLFPLVPQ